RVLDGRVERERAEPDIVAADRKQHEIDRPLATGWRAPLLGNRLRRDARAAILVHRQSIARGLRAALGTAAADQVRQLIELRRHRRLLTSNALSAEARPKLLTFAL